MTSPHDIIKRLEAATGADREIDLAICRVHPDAEVLLALAGTGRDVPRYTASLDATIALVERMKPGLQWQIRRDSADLFERDPECGKSAFGYTPAIALLLALFRSIGEDNG